MAESKRSSLKQILSNPQENTEELDEDHEEEEKDSLFSEPEERKRFDDGQIFLLT